ncbi:MAG TPA: methyltransferase [Paracoccaceae bacterium]|nr:methyltransferase [Paracoccaceae bacterium]HMO72992.1 methyltransferase [Paracoccaceae bacterium]
MVGLPEAAGAGAAQQAGGAFARLLSSRRFQAWAARVPGLRRIVRAEGAAIFDLIQGFVKSQVLMALVELDLLAQLARPRAPAELAPAAGLTGDRMAMLLQAGAAAGLLRRRRDGRFVLSSRGAAFQGVPGLPAMVRHHAVLYRDLADPVGFLRGETAPDLARFWPYVFGAAAAEDPATAQRYSRLMEDSQALVAEDTLRLVDLSGVTHLMDVGGGTGAFLRAVAAAHPRLRLTLFDLPAVLSAARLPPAIARAPGSFRDDDLPRGADAISLVRVLYDHSDATVGALLARCHAALPPGGRLIVSEPMSGGDRPDPSTDIYFAFYCAAMQTGRTRSPAEIARLLAAAGFGGIIPRPGMRPFVTSAVVAWRT